MTLLFQPLQGLTEVVRFQIPSVQTWGTTKDAQYKQLMREIANLPNDIGKDYQYFVFLINSVIGESRRRKQGPDVKNIPKLIVDAFTGILFPDDNLDYVRGIQVEAIFGPDEQEHTEVRIYGISKDTSLSHRPIIEDH